MRPTFCHWHHLTKSQLEPAYRTHRYWPLTCGILSFIMWSDIASSFPPVWVNEGEKQEWNKHKHKHTTSHWTSTLWSPPPWPVDMQGLCDQMKVNHRKLHQTCRPLCYSYNKAGGHSPIEWLPVITSPVTKRCINPIYIMCTKGGCRQCVKQYKLSINPSYLEQHWWSHDAGEHTVYVST